MEKAFFMAQGLFDIQRVFRQDHPGVIGIQTVSYTHLDDVISASEVFKQ